MSVKESYAGKINRKLNKKLHVIDVAAGRVPADLVLKNATYVNVFSNELSQCDIAVAEGLIVGMGEYHGKVEMDVSGKIVLPGFLDAHIHLESSHDYFPERSHGHLYSGNCLFPVVRTEYNNCLCHRNRQRVHYGKKHPYSLAMERSEWVECLALRYFCAKIHRIYFGICMFLYHN